MNIRFEWDPDKAHRNFVKHGVAFEEAQTIFNDESFVTVIDDEHSDNKDRYITIGVSGKGRLLVVAHTDRAHDLRIISARMATRKEEIFYAETTAY